MDLQKLKPWNWFKREEQEQPEVLPARRDDATGDPLLRMHQEMDRMFDQFLGRVPGSALAGRTGSLWLKPSVDIAEGRKAYRISVEVPGISEDEIDLSIDGDDLIISGEKRQEHEEDEEGYHRIERSYGQFRRVLSLPGDADTDRISARFKNGVLDVQVPRRKDGERPGVRRIEIER
ncbi:heat shock protein Hsp20 [Thioalkalivibrio sp. K90mix]|uniref:Hsp20/alpha crystallin family protein n=1 Tax=unclassified Thioalkalivibrio TaxID=2621013 RepID=UPI000195AB0A|nr:MULTISPECIES: Hsp20/alpha crystallin family protein [unclassified Thioalkalivibrio]ADC71872.1 heat shock protein Hsp20 [Thioalkalivibrio sp. K90mix]